MLRSGVGAAHVGIDKVVGLYQNKCIIANRQSPIANRQSPIANRQSPIANRQSPIANRQSPIANRQSRARSHLRNDHGFSIVGVLVAAGMLGGLSLYLATVTRQQHVTQRKAETGAELVELHHKIIAVLYDSDACLATLGKGNILQVGPLNKLVNKGNKTMLAIGDEINRNLKVENMEIENIANAGPQSKQAEIKVTLKKLGVANAGVITEKRFKITVELDTAGKITRCHHTLDSKEHGIKTSMCEDVGGEMVSVPGSPTTECTLTNVYKMFCENLGGTYTDPAAGTPIGQCDTNNVFQSYCTSLGGQYTVGTPIGTCNIADTYVDVAGDTMTGSLGTTILRANSAVISGNIGANQGMFAGNITGSGNIVAGGDMSAANVNASGKVTAGGPAPVIPQPTQPPASCLTGYEVNPCKKIAVAVSRSYGGVCSSRPKVKLRWIRQEEQTLPNGTICYKCVIEDYKHPNTGYGYCPDHICEHRNVSNPGSYINRNLRGCGQSSSQSYPYKIYGIGGAFPANLHQ